MATGHIYNGFGQYEKRDGEIGVALQYAGLDFWLPYQKVTSIPNWTFREIDHDRSTPNGDTEGVLVYQSIMVNGNRIVEELCNKQMPISHAMMGIMPIAGINTGRTITVQSGVDADGHVLTAEIPEREATKNEIAEAERRSDEYKRQVIGDYFQSKRERMTGAPGKNRPDERTRVYMTELNVEDLDDVTSHQKTEGGVNVDLVTKLVKEILAGNNEDMAENIVRAVKTVRSNTKAQLTPAVAASLRLDVRKAAFDALPIEEQERRLATGKRLKEAREAKQQLVNTEP